MRNVVIVDDEPIIVQGLISIVPWAEFNCRVVGTAEDGYAGAAVIREKKPDVLFTDIRMPMEDGLTMLAGLRSEFPRMQVTVLTGYRDFAYAQTAIRLGVSRYILKPSRIEEIREALTVMTAELDRLEPEKASDAPEQPEREANNFIVRNAMQYIEAHYAEKLTLQEVAEKTFVSQWHLSKLLNRHAEQSFFEILNGVRIREATKLLRDPSLRISDVSAAVGFTDVAHFSRVFRKITGFSANEYRNKET